MSRTPHWISSHLAALRALLVLTVVLGLAYPLGMVLIGQLPGLKDNADGSLITGADGKVIGSSEIGQSFADRAGNPLPRYFQSRPSAAVNADTGQPYDPMTTAASNLGPESVVDTLPDPKKGWDRDDNASRALLTQVCRRSFDIGRTEGVDGSRPYCARSGDNAVGAVLGVYRSGGLTGEVTRVVSLNEECGTIKEPFRETYRGVKVTCARYGADYSRAIVTPIRGHAPGHSPIPPDAVAGSASGLDPDVSPRYAELQVRRVAHERGMTRAAVRELVGEYTTGRFLGFMGEPSVNVLELNVALDKRHPVKK
ncbi:MAG TPA: potassium-transporting ATPase subunit C [Stackebrandtia sp.]|jgi:K+-transporting ATPase ATPase C chain|uniref:potassium-transporting ATPase subunit C n=1 Tax=Stackebrandtia sp. TaxID=2023065 RepID=UPI002D53CB30|nr:potassium-transporting ATPase subunit C [Stackebrandtia sp.]HZE40223.1 potassium-transporting ATPase subunit C [Stackebrandtia sp.]